MKKNSIRTRSVQILTGMALGMAVSTPDVVHAADQLAWDKTFPQSDKVIHQKVSFHNRLGINLVADLYIPKNLDRSKKYPAMVVGGPYGAVKEQSSGLYAQTMAERGFVATEKSSDIDKEFYDYYRTPRGQHPRSSTAFWRTSAAQMMLFWSFEHLDWMSPRPVLFITGNHAHSRIFSEHAFKKASEPKELYVVPNAGHVDLYDRVNVIPWEKLTAFFTEHLK